MISGVSNGGYSSMTLSSMGGSRGGPDLSKLQEKLFAKADANGDGSIDKSELSSLLKSNASSDGSGSSSSDIDTLFSALDSDGSGSVSKDETSAAISKVLEQLQSQLSSAMGGGRPHGPGGPGGPGGDPAKMFSDADSDGDGSISKSELTSLLQSKSSDQGRDVSSKVDQILKQDDSDGDGAISQSEFTSAMDKRRSDMESRMAQSGPPPAPPSGQRGDQVSAASGADSSSSSDTSDTSSSNGNELSSFINALLQQYRNASSTASNSLVSTLSVVA